MQKAAKNNILINKLITQTRERKLIWAITSKPEKYALFLNENQIIVESYQRVTGHTAYDFVIYDKFGNTVEKLTYIFGFRDESFPNIKILFDAIKVNVDLKIGNTIDSIITELG